MTSPKQKLRTLRRGPRWQQAETRVLGFAVWCVLWFLRRTTRLELAGIEPLEACWREGRPMVLAFWHGRSLMLPFLARGREAWIMNSTHRDGEIITRALGRMGIRTTRGSSRRNAVSGTLGLFRALRAGKPVALIPDGPRGPAGVAKPGAVELAMRAGAPLFPIAFSASPALRMGGWDRMLIPLPGARVRCVVGAAIGGDGETADKATRARMRAELEQSLHELCRRADREVGRTEEDR